MDSPAPTALFGDANEASFELASPLPRAEEEEDQGFIYDDELQQQQQQPNIHSPLAFDAGDYQQQQQQQQQQWPQAQSLASPQPPADERPTKRARHDEENGNHTGAGSEIFFDFNDAAAQEASEEEDESDEDDEGSDEGEEEEEAPSQAPAFRQEEEDDEEDDEEEEVVEMSSESANAASAIAASSSKRKPKAPRQLVLLPSASRPQRPLVVLPKEAATAEAAPIDTEIKYGTVCCTVYGVRICPGKAVVDETLLLTRIPSEADSNATRVDNAVNQPVGVLGKPAAAMFAPLLDAKTLRMHARVSAVDENDLSLRVDVFGPSRRRRATELHMTRHPAVTYISFNPEVFKQVVVEATTAAAAAAAPVMSAQEIEANMECLFNADVADETAIGAMKPAKRPAGIRTEMKPYQLQGLAWMIRQETVRHANPAADKSSIAGWTRTTNEAGEALYTNTATKETSKEPPRLARGGLIADEMGLGKTLQVLSLVASSLPEDAKARARQAPTLIVCPLSVITNWEEQIKEHFHPSHPLKYYTYHGPNRMRDVNQLATYDVIITTYNVISQEYGIYTIGNEDDDEQEDDFGDTGAAATTASKKRASKKRKKGKSAAASMLAFDTKEATLFGMEFWRVVLDEGHLIRNSKSKQSLAARALRSERRWALSGTPLVNNLDDAFALLNFIGVPPFTTYARWHQVMRGSKAMERVKQIMSTMCIRRTKNECINGERILQLPTKYQRTRLIKLSGKEEALYKTLVDSGRNQFNRLLESDAVLKRYAYVLEILLRMRQACNHAMLVPLNYHKNGFSGDLSADRAAELHRLVSLLDEGMADECGLCGKTCEDPVITQCAHFHCRACFDGHQERVALAATAAAAAALTPSSSLAFAFSSSSSSPVAAATSAAASSALPPLVCPIADCGQVLDRELIVGMQHRDLLKLEQEQKIALALHKSGKVTMSPKLVALFEELQVALGRGEKSVVFSQWTSFLDIVQVALTTAGVSFVRLDGQMSSANRAKALTAFKDDENVKVFLISLKAGGCPIFGEQIVLASGEIKAAEELTIDDQLVGQGGRTMRITSLNRDCRADHHFVLTMGSRVYRVSPGHLVTVSRRRHNTSHKSDELIDVPVEILHALPQLWKSASDNHSAHLLLARLDAIPHKHERKSKLVTPITAIVRVDESSAFVELSVAPVGEPRGDESDRRYLLANGVLTHNCGLNLTSANHVFLCDSWWAPSQEDQAIDRVHRLGQKRHVEVVRFVIKGSVEEKILKMQTDKRCMAMQALTRNTRGRETQQAARLEDLVHLFE